MATKRSKAVQGARAADAAIPIASGGSILRPLKASEAVAREVVRDISANGLQPGDPLDSEAQMLKNYGVSRESLREGLRLLEVNGMISLRRGPGGGPIVGTVDPTNLGRVQALFFHLAGATYDELFDAWILAETILARRAAGNPDEDARRKAMAPYIAGHVHVDEHASLEAFVEGHTGFHSAVAALARNRVLQLGLRSYGQIVAHHVATVGDPRSIEASLEEDHIKLASAIAEGDVTLAGELMTAHLGNVADVNRASLGDLVDRPVEWL